MEGNLFLRHTTDGPIGHSGGNERATPGGNRPRSSSNVYGVCKECCCVSLGFISCILSVWNQSFDSPVETDVVRRFPTSEKVFVFTLAGTRTRDLLHGQLHALTTQPLRLWKLL